MSNAASSRFARHLPQHLWRRSLTLLFVFGTAISVLTGGAAAKTQKHRRGHRSATPRSVAAHVETWAFDDGCNGGEGASPALVHTWVTFAEANCGPTSRKALSDCHSGGRVYCRVMQYVDSDWQYPDQSPRLATTSSETWWLHESAPNGGTRIWSPESSGGGYLDNQAVPGVRLFFQSYVRNHFNSDDGLLMDWQSPSLNQELYYSNCGCSSTSEIRSNRGLQAAHTAMAASMSHRNGTMFVQADNTLPSNPFLPQGLNMLNHSIGVDGWTVEGEPESNGALDPYYSTLLDQTAYIATRTKGYIAPMSRAPMDAPYQAQSRRVQEATILLGFSPGHIVDWADLEQGAEGLAVWPEEGIYPTRPVQSMRVPRGRGCLAGTGVVCSRGGHNSVQVAPGVYRRVFRDCYRRRSSFGACGAIVNTTPNAVQVRRSWLRGVSLHHEITFVGGDVQSGGTVRLRGAPFTAGSTVIEPEDAVLLAR